MKDQEHQQLIDAIRWLREHKIAPAKLRFLLKELSMVSPTEHKELLHTALACFEALEISVDRIRRALVLPMATDFRLDLEAVVSSIQELIDEVRQ
jgi:hypothetical protein